MLSAEELDFLRAQLDGIDWANTYISSSAYHGFSWHTVKRIYNHIIEQAKALDQAQLERDSTTHAYNLLEEERGRLAGDLQWTRHKFAEANDKVIGLEVQRDRATRIEDAARAVVGIVGDSDLDFGKAHLALAESLGVLPDKLLGVWADEVGQYNKWARPQRAYHKERKRHRFTR